MLKIFVHESLGQVTQATLGEYFPKYLPNEEIEVATVDHEADLVICKSRAALSLLYHPKRHFIVVLGGQEERPQKVRDNVKFIPLAQMPVNLLDMVRERIATHA